MKDFANACGFGEPSVTPKMMEKLKKIAKAFGFSQEAVQDMAFVGMPVEMIVTEMIAQWITTIKQPM